MQKNQRNLTKVPSSNEKPSLHDNYWNLSDPTWVLWPKVVPRCHPGTVSVDLLASEVPIGSLGDPKIAKNSTKSKFCKKFNEI